MISAATKNMCDRKINRSFATTPMCPMSEFVTSSDITKEDYLDAYEVWPSSLKFV